MFNKWFMVDTGSACSIWLHYLAFDKPQPSVLNFYVVNQIPIKTYGQISLFFNLGLRRDFKWLFIVANVPYPILDVDFLKYFTLLQDVKIQRLIDGSMSLSTPASVSTNILFTLSFLLSLLETNSIFSCNFTLSCLIQHSKLLMLYTPLSIILPWLDFLFLFIHVVLPQIVLRRWKLSVSISFSSVFFDLLQVCEHLLSILFVKKKNFRPVGDYYWLNAVIIADRYTILNFQVISANLHGCKVFLKVDFIWVYHQIPLNTSNIPKPLSIYLLILLSSCHLDWGSQPVHSNGLLMKLFIVLTLCLLT